jgi:hypothetical protein
MRSVMRDEEIRACHDDHAITVYQAYPVAIAEPAARDGAFPSWYRRDRMTWIKPSFLWMMYRSGWATNTAWLGREHGGRRPAAGGTSGAPGRAGPDRRNLVVTRR